jgi:hypothetical protein
VRLRARLLVEWRRLVLTLVHRPLVTGCLVVIAVAVLPPGPGTLLAVLALGVLVGLWLDLALYVLLVVVERVTAALEGRRWVPVPLPGRCPCLPCRRSRGVTVPAPRTPSVTMLERAG